MSIAIPRPINTAPKTRDDLKAVPFLGWCRADEGIGDSEPCWRIVWWEPLMNNAAGLWWGDRDIEEFPTHWLPLPAAMP